MNKKDNVMKRDKEDEKLAKMLKQHSAQPEPNEWFTARVVNRLPERRRSLRWLMPLVYLVAFIVCLAICLCYVKTHVQMAVTVRDVFYFAVMFAVTLYLGCQLVLDIVHDD